MMAILTALILLTAFPIGYLLAWLARDELVAEKRWFAALTVVFFVIMLILLFVYRNYQIILTLAYIIIVCLVSIWKSCNLHGKRD